MKTIKCSALGDHSCDFEVTASTIEEARMKILEHAKENHPEMSKDATPEAKAAWEEKLKRVWDHTEEAT